MTPMTPGRLGYLAFMLLAVAAFFLARRLFPAPRPPRLTRLEALTLGLAAFVGGTPAATLPWCVTFGDGVCRHPTQIYESLFHAVWAVILVRLTQRDLLRYQRLKLYLIAYCVYRFLIEFIRTEPKWLGDFTYYQVVVAGF